MNVIVVINERASATTSSYVYSRSTTRWRPPSRASTGFSGEKETSLK
jgi:hypothetical protein